MSEQSTPPVRLDRRLGDVQGTTAFFDCYSIAANDRPVRLHDQPRKVTSTMSRPAWKVTDGNIAKVLDMEHRPTAAIHRQGSIRYELAARRAHRKLPLQPGNLRRPHDHSLRRLTTAQRR
jgi:hypothetical protein